MTQSGPPTARPDCAFCYIGARRKQGRIETISTGRNVFCRHFHEAYDEGRSAAVWETCGSGLIGCIGDS